MDFLFALPVKVGMTMILFLLLGSIDPMNLDIVYLSLKMVGCMNILPNCVQLLILLHCSKHILCT